MMRKLAVGVATVAIMVGASSIALAEQLGTFQIVPAPGVTVRELPQERLNWISNTAQAHYSQGLAQAEANFDARMRSIGVDPVGNHSGNVMTGRYQEIVRLRDVERAQARVSAGNWANATCAGLCYTVYIN